MAWKFMKLTEEECTKAKAKTKHILFHGTARSGAAVTVRNRQDRTPIVVIYEAKRQLLQLTVHEPSKQNIYQEAAIAIAKEYIEKDLAKQELIALRAKLLEENGCGLAKVAKREAPNEMIKHDSAEQEPETPVKEDADTNTV
eukprot:4035701-Lingulodinium_polyedra.AAC.1